MDNKKLIWLASYPKSGNTWFRILLTNYLKKEDEQLDINNLYQTTIASSRSLFDEATGVSSSDLTFNEIDYLRPKVYEHIAKNSEEIIFHKIHDAWQILPNGEPLIPSLVTKGVIYIVRNPLDVAVSFANHSSLSIDKMIKAMQNPDYSFCEKGSKLFIQLRQRLNSWSGHLKSWLDESNLPVFIIKYEDMLMNPFDSFKKALKFVYNDVDDNKLVRAIEESSFDIIKEHENKDGFSERSAKSPVFFRKGKSGTWQKELNRNQVELICKEHYDIMNRFGYIPQ